MPFNQNQMVTLILLKQGEEQRHVLEIHSDH